MDLATIPAREGAALALRLEIVDYFASARPELRQVEAFALRGVDQVLALIDFARTSTRTDLWLDLAEVRLASAWTDRLFRGAVRMRGDPSIAIGWHGCWCSTSGGVMFHWILTRVCGWDRRVFFTSVPDVCFAHYYDQRGRVRWSRKLK